ncbi:MAG: hypothetical protein MK105_18745 [Crocinitomicaceae bacterium]|nr:hypothetical protein [Crocinitomicaceae bacterium]
MSDFSLPEEIRAEFTVNADGRTTTTIRGAARLAGVNEKALRYQFSTAEKSAPKLAQKLMEHGFNPAEFSTNGITEVALSVILEFYSFDAGARCTQQARLVYKAFASIGIRAWLQQQLDYQPTNTNPTPESTLTEIDHIFSGLYKLNIKPELIESAKLTAIAKTFPHLATAAEESKQLVSAHNQVEEIPLSPTKLGKIIAEQLGLSKPISARRINQILITVGFQDSERVSNSKGKTKLQYKLTELGEKYARIQLDTARGHNKTVYVIRWFKSVIPIITEAMNNDQ